MRWDKIEGDVWETPPEHHKGKRMIVTPLSSEAMKVLDPLREIATHDEWEFPSREGAKEPFIANVSSKTLQRIRRKSGSEDWTSHDLRRTLRQWLCSAPSHPRTPGLGIREDVVDYGILTHKQQGLGVTRYTPDSERACRLFPE